MNTFNPYEDAYTQGLEDERERVISLVERLRPETTSLVVAALCDGRTENDIACEWAELVNQHAEKQKAEAEAIMAQVAAMQKEQATLDAEVTAKVEAHKISAEERSRRETSAAVRQACHRLTHLNGRHMPNRNRTAVGVSPRHYEKNTLIADASGYSSRKA